MQIKTLAVALAASIALCNGAFADSSISIDTSPAGVIRSDISRGTFGGGMEAYNSQVRWSMDLLENTSDPQTVNGHYTRLLGDTIGFLNLGMMRFPNGNSSFGYVWDNPNQSDPGLSAYDQYNNRLRSDEIYRYTASLSMDRLFTVNTVFFYDGGIHQTAPSPFYYIDSNVFNTSAPVVNTDALSRSANWAASWVSNSQEGAQTTWWEIGNEDWSRWSEAQYADIAYTFASAMKTARSPIYLLVEGLIENQTIKGNYTNTPAMWLSTLKTKFSGSLDQIYGYSIHQYLTGGSYGNDTSLVRRQKQTQDMLAQVAAGQAVENTKYLLGTNDPNSSTRNWKIWMTEFNIYQPDANNLPLQLQDMGHALVIADWTGKLLEQNVERMFFQSLDTHPSFGAIHYGQPYAFNGVTYQNDIEHPRVTVPGFAYSIYAQEFGSTMLRNSIGTNPTLVAPNGIPYPQLSAYSSLSADGNLIRMIVINRSLTDSATININTATTTPRRILDNAQYVFRELKSAQVTDSNLIVTNAVRWSDPVWRNQTASGIGTTIAPASANLFIVPLQPQ